MAEKKDETMQPRMSDLKKHGKHLLLYLLIASISCGLFLLGWYFYEKEPRMSQILISLGIALGPVSFLGMIYDWFLFDEIREGAKIAFTSEIYNYLDPVISKMTHHTNELMSNTFILSQMHKLGIVAAYKERRIAFTELKEIMRYEEKELFIIGTSLRGLVDEEVGDKEFQDILRNKFIEIEEGSSLRIKILMTHPAFAYLRQDLEKLYSQDREQISIAKEIYNSVRQLKELGAKPENIQFVKGTPTCFGVKTSKKMLINPYPYQDQALGSFCLLIGKDPNRDDLYRSFERSHFIWDSPNTVKIESFSAVGVGKVFAIKLQELMPSPEAVKVEESHWD